MRGLSPFLSLLCWALPFAKPAQASGLHPLKTPLAPADIQFRLLDAARAGEVVGVECTYRPARERDVRKQRHLHLIGSPWRAGSRDLLTVDRDEAHTIRTTAREANGSLVFSVAMRDPDPAHANYFLAQVQVARLRFERWFKTAPALDPNFGLKCDDDKLRGSFCPGGMAAPPLGGALPLWPDLRLVDVTIEAESRPVVRIWDSSAKHYWDGWRYFSPESWSGGRSIVTRHREGGTVWWSHEYEEYPSTATPEKPLPAPPAGALVGAALQVFWPQGDTLEFPDVYFEQPVSTIALRVNDLTERARRLLAQSVALRPGVESGSLSAAEWNELEALAAPPASKPVNLTMDVSATGKDVLTIHRGQLDERWVYLFGAEYASGRRVALTALVLDPAPWSGPMPEDMPQ